MQLVSVNLGKAQMIQNAKASGKTGIYKRFTSEAVQISCDGLVGDTICDTENHGGVDQAVYVYGVPDYAWWSEQLGRELGPGTFGENLTVTGLESAALNVGDILRVGTARLQVTAPRIPCVTLAVRMEDPTFLKRFRRAERPGVYCRVLQEGWVQRGDAVALNPYEGETLGVLEMFRDFFEPKLDERAVRRHLAAPIAIRDRVDQETKLRKLLQAREQ